MDHCANNLFTGHYRKATNEISGNSFTRFNDGTTAAYQVPMPPTDRSATMLTNGQDVATVRN